MAEGELVGLADPDGLAEAEGAELPVGDWDGDGVLLRDGEAVTYSATKGQKGWSASMVKSLRVPSQQAAKSN